MDQQRSRSRRSRARLGAATVLALALVTAACGDDGDGSSDPSSTGASSGTTAATAAATTTTAAPQMGGSVTVGQFAGVTGFDPANATVAGSTNGMELAAMYGTLLRYDAATASYLPFMAAGIEKNADFTQWTIKLRSGVKFTDGTAYDAAAVKLNIERHMAPTARSTARPALLQYVNTITAADPQTVVISLKQGWAGFPFLLTVGPGMILSPAAIEKAGANLASEPGDAGAGPFKLASYKAGEGLVLKKNPTYWDGTVYLDELKFIQAGAPDKTYIALQTGTLQAAYLRDPLALASAKKDGYPSVLIPSPGGNIALLNSGVVITCTAGAPAYVCTGKPDGTKVETSPPTKDVRVRLAVAYAIDRAAMNQRVWSDTATVGAQLIDKSLPIYSDVTFPDYNPTEAKRLVQEAKAAGWNGSVRVLADSSNATWGVTVKSLLEAVGFTVDLDTTKPLSGVITQVSANRDFDIASWGSGMDATDADFFFTSTNFVSSTGRYGLKSTGFDAALDQMRLASTADQKKAAYKALSEAWAKDMPAVPIATIYQGVVGVKNLQGLVTSGGGIVLFDKAYFAK